MGSADESVGEQLAHERDEPGLGDFHAFEAGPGEFIRFDGNRCWHYTTANDTGATRALRLSRRAHRALDNEHQGPSKTIHRGNGKSAAAAHIKPLRMGEYYVDSGVDVRDE